MIAALLMAGHIYTVKPGDTLWGIVGNRWPTVCEANHIRNCNLIYPGEKIVIGNRTFRSAVTEPDNDGSLPASHPVGGGNLSCSGLESLWMAAGGNSGSAFIAAEIAMAESGGQQYATGPAGERGYWQINPVNGYLSTYDPYGNARAAVILSDNGRNWSPWTTYTSGAYLGRCLHESHRY